MRADSRMHVHVTQPTSRATGAAKSLPASAVAIVAQTPMKDGREDLAFAGQITLSSVPSHSSAKSSDKKGTPPISATFSQPMRLLGKAQVPSVTVRDLAKSAP